MGSFGFKKVKQRLRYQRINIGFGVFVVSSFLLFSIFSRMQHAVMADQSSGLFDQDLNELALYVSTYDPRAASVLLSMQRVVQGYKNDDFLKTYGPDIENILQYLSNNPDKFQQLGLQQYEPFIDFITKISAQKGDIFSLLGKEKKQTYIIALQNTAEKRPNGGFFGSFVKISIFDAKIIDMQFVDSYVPGIIRPDVTLQAPSWASPFLGDDNVITFLASNKFGFTDIDGKNIKRLYDRTYGDDIRGVVFVQSALFADLIPGFQELLREWQFANASIDLIRGQALPNKKELYFDGVSEFIKTHQQDIIKSLIKHFAYVQENRYIQTYLVRVTPELTQILQDSHLQTVFDNDYLYLWDYNSSFNKIDTFVQKTMTLIDSKNMIIRETNDDVIDISGIKSGSYTLRTQYILSIPESYTQFIQSLTKQFGITLNTREKHILALFPEWSTRGVLYASKNITIKKISGPTKTNTIFASPFSNNAFYILENTQNHTIKEVRIDIEIE